VELDKPVLMKEKFKMLWSMEGNETTNIKEQLSK
jgi:hypothetical protein